ncbi:MAG TPA: peptidoglycan recognition family protein [Candidatus Saccharimonadales bacterium]|nr:peptidoglycan recognition family protein [Candidatus Saccharimonadales bacterium]
MSRSSKPDETSFDKTRWLEAIKSPDWYVEFIKTAKSIEKNRDPEIVDKFRRDSRHFFESQLEQGNIALGKNGPNLDAQREPIDTIVIHHTSHKPGYRLSYLNATHMLVIYAPYFMNPTVQGEENLKNKPLWSGHFKDGKQVFWGYHWLMRMDGKFEKLLEDEQLGWHAGNWQINRRSVAICLDNDYENQDPTDDVLKKLAGFIKEKYPEIKNVIGHREARGGTTCPGVNFLTIWKLKLVKYLEENDHSQKS